MEPEYVNDSSKKQIKKDLAKPQTRAKANKTVYRISRVGGANKIDYYAVLTKFISAVALKPNLRLFNARYLSALRTNDFLAIKAESPTKFLVDFKVADDLSLRNSDIENGLAGILFACAHVMVKGETFYNTDINGNMVPVNFKMDVSKVTEKKPIVYLSEDEVTAAANFLYAALANYCFSSAVKQVSVNTIGAAGFTAAMNATTQSGNTSKFVAVYNSMAAEHKPKVVAFFRRSVFNRLNVIAAFYGPISLSIYSGILMMTKDPMLEDVAKLLIVDFKTPDVIRDPISEVSSSELVELSITISDVDFKLESDTAIDEADKYTVLKTKNVAYVNKANE